MAAQRYYLSNVNNERKHLIRQGWVSHLAVELPCENSSNEWLEPVADEHYLLLK